jgi:hypothetical protein
MAFVDALARAMEIQKEQKTALIAAVACHMEGEAWNAC